MPMSPLRSGGEWGEGEPLAAAMQMDAEESPWEARSPPETGPEPVITLTWAGEEAAAGIAGKSAGPRPLAGQAGRSKDALAGAPGELHPPRERGSPPGLGTELDTALPGDLPPTG